MRGRIDSSFNAAERLIAPRVGGRLARPRSASFHKNTPRSQSKAVLMGRSEAETLKRLDAFQEFTFPTPSCLGEDTLPARFFHRVRLDHVVYDYAPLWVLVKASMVCILVNLVDKGTQNPDTVMSTFVALQCLSAFVIARRSTSFSILIASLLGTAVGTVVAIITVIPVENSAFRYMGAFRIPLSVVVTWYLLMFLDRYDPGSTATGLFNALYPHVWQTTYPPLNIPESQYGLIWSTLVVRLISLFTSVLVAHLVNVIFSAPNPAQTIRSQSFYAEQQVWSTHAKDADPLSEAVQIGYSRVVKLVAMEQEFKSIMSAWCFSKQAKKDVNLLMLRHKAIFEYMAFRSFLHVYIKHETSPVSIVCYSLHLGSSHFSFQG